jgi:hypothetical protein
MDWPGIEFFFVSSCLCVWLSVLDFQHKGTMAQSQEGRFILYNDVSQLNIHGGSINSPESQVFRNLKESKLIRKAYTLVK